MARQRSFLPLDLLDFTNEESAANLLAEVNPLLWVSIVEPWKRLQLRRGKDEEFRELTEREIAWWLHGRIKRTASEMCDRYPNFNAVASAIHARQFVLTIAGKAVVIFKKIRRNKSKKRLERSNYKTTGNLDLWQQRRGEGLSDLPRLILGYEPIKELTEIDIRVCYPRSRGLGFRWTYSMPDQTNAVRGLLADNKVEAPSVGERRKGFIVRHRRMDSQEHEAK